MEVEGQDKLEDMNAIIKIENLRRTFDVGIEKVHALKGVSFEVQEGEFVSIMGTSGSGKSTLLNILGCLDRPTSGEYYIDGIAVSERSKDELSVIRNRKIGFVFQSYNLLARTSALENVELPLLYNSSVSRSEGRREPLMLSNKWACRIEWIICPTSFPEGSSNGLLLPVH